MLSPSSNHIRVLFLAAALCLALVVACDVTTTSPTELPFAEATVIVATPTQVPEPTPAATETSAAEVGSAGDEMPATVAAETVAPPTATPTPRPTPTPTAIPTATAIPVTATMPSESDDSTPTPEPTATQAPAIATPHAMTDDAVPVPSPTPEAQVVPVSPTALVEGQQVEVDPTVAVPDEVTPTSDSAMAGGVPVVPPCTPYPGSDKDPCERRVPWEWPRLKNPNFFVDTWEPWPPFTVRELVDSQFDYWFTVPHFIVRGVAIPGSTRCALHGSSVLLKGSATDTIEAWNAGTNIDCYTDIAVREYIFGSGPSRITYKSASRSVDELSDDYGTVKRDAAYFADITSPLAESLEGYEWIFSLSTPLAASHGAWAAPMIWDVQRLDDGSVVGVSTSRVGSDDEAAYLDELEPALDNFVADTKAAMAHYVELYDGKIGDSPDAPSFIASPELSSVYEYIKSMGALDVPGFTFEPPPPSPLAPCAPYPGSDKDPCERRVPWEWPRLKNSNSRATIFAPWPPFTVREWVDRKFEYWPSVPHFVVRGIPVPGSSRCASHGHPVFLPESATEPLAAGGPIAHIDCYVDIEVREYIFGSGPSRVTLLAAWRAFDDISPDFGSVERDAAYFADISSPLVENFEGYEWIFWLATPTVASQGAWKATFLWDVQRLDDGTIVGVSRYRAGHDDESEYLDELEPAIDDLVADTKAAMAHYVGLYGGKIGDSPNAPSFIASAELESVYEYIKLMGALDVPGFTFEPPPPSPLATSAPTGLQATLMAGQPPAVRLEWTAPASSRVKSYKIVRVDSAGSESMILATVSADLLEYTDTNLPTTGEEYTYTVIAVNAHGESAPSAAVTIRVP